MAVSPEPLILCFTSIPPREGEITMRKRMIATAATLALGLSIAAAPTAFA